MTATERRLSDSLNETLAALERHILDEANAQGFKHAELFCPCWANEVRRARELLDQLGVVRKGVNS